MSSDKQVNIIAFDVPYPPDYGGVIDIYYKIKSLYEAGVKVHLHCFEYGRHPREELKEVCASVNYYQRKTAKSMLFNTLPYIVLSRESEVLKKNLLKNNYPILMEGLHSTFLLNEAPPSPKGGSTHRSSPAAVARALESPSFGGVGEARRIIVRTHNVEHDYYESLAHVESNIFKRYYFYNEAGKLKKYESALKSANAIAAISPNDAKYYSSLFKHVHYIPAFHPHAEITAQEGRGDYFFYHANLSVGENNEAALFLVNKVFNNLSQDLVIAGNKPSDDLQKAVRGKANIELLDDLSPGQIQEYIANAHCNILPTFQATGIKLKLLSALFAGRFCIVNKPMVTNTGLESLCIVANTAEAMKEKIKSISEKDFPQKEINKRQSILLENFSNEKNVKKLMKVLF